MGCTDQNVGRGDSGLFFNLFASSIAQLHRNAKKVANHQGEFGFPIGKDNTTGEQLVMNVS